MRLTTFTDYCLRVLLYLAARPGRRATIGEVAAAFEVSGHHLVKVVHFLGKSGWLVNVRGRGGGMELAMPAERINIADVVRDAEGAAQVVEGCREGPGGCVIAPVCKLRGAVGEAVGAFYASLARHTLADMVRNREQIASVLFFPAAKREPSRKRA